jgi:hypothetical protein
MADIARGIVTAGSRQQIIQNGLAATGGIERELCDLVVERWALIFTVVAGGPIDLFPAPFKVPVYRLSNGEHQLLYFNREGTLVQQAWFGFSAVNTSINITEIRLIADR